MLSCLPDQDLGLPLEPRLLHPGQGHLHPGGQHRGLPRRRRPRPARDPRVEVIPLGDGAPDLRQERDEVPRRRQKGISQRLSGFIFYEVQVLRCKRDGEGRRSE